MKNLLCNVWNPSVARDLGFRVTSIVYSMLYSARVVTSYAGTVKSTFILI